MIWFSLLVLWTISINANKLNTQINDLTVITLFNMLFLSLFLRSHCPKCPGDTNDPVVWGGATPPGAWPAGWVEQMIQLGLRWGCNPN